MSMSPKRVLHRKVHRGCAKGSATRTNHVDFGEIALVAMGSTWLDARVIEAARVAINRRLDRKGQMWIRVFPDKPISKKPAEVRMGGGKGAPDHWAAVIRPGTVLFEVAGVDLSIAHRALELAASKLPIVTKIMYKPTKD